MEWDDNVLEENDVLVSEWNGKTTNDTCENIQKFGGTIELMSLMNKKMETLVDSLSNHFSSWDELSIKLMKNVLKIVSLNRLFGIEKFKEFLNELWGDVLFEGSNFDSLVDDELEEEFIDTLNMWP